MKFLRLSNMVLNVNNINTISIKPNKYYVNYSNNINGGGFVFFYAGFWNIKSGVEFEICKTKDPDDYETLTKLIEKID